MTVGLHFLGLRWRALVPGGESLPALGMTAAVAAGMLLNYALPGPVGELAAPLLVQRRYGMPAETTLAASIHARFIGLASAGAIAGVAWALGPLPVPEDYELLVGVAAACIAAGALALGLLSARPQLLRALAGWTIGRIPGRIAQGTHGAVVRVADSLGRVGRIGWRAYSRATLWSLAGHASVCTGILVGAWAMGMHPAVAGVIFPYAAATAGVVALFALPGGQLGWDALFCSFFVVTTGVELADALAITLMVRVQQIVLLLLGAASLTLLGGRSEASEPG
jgi:hypothetical protein